MGHDFSIAYTVEVGSMSYLDPWDWIGVYEADFLSLEDYVSFTWASLCRLTAQEKEVRNLRQSTAGFAFNRQNPRPWSRSGKLAVKTAV